MPLDPRFRVLLILAVLFVCSRPLMADPADQPVADPPAADEQKPTAEKPEEEADPFAWQSSFDGKTLQGWKVPNLGGEGEVTVKDGSLVMAMGDPMTGVVWTGKYPKINYELRFEARRMMGIDFFCTTTFPHGDAPCSLVVGGWAGTVVGLSCVDWYDAADNTTSQFMAFKDKQWYAIRLRVTEQRIEAWIDDEKLVDLPTEGHKFTIRDECDLFKPLGICTWCTEGHVRKLRIRRLKPEEVAKIPAEQ